MNLILIIYFNQWTLSSLIVILNNELYYHYLLFQNWIPHLHRMPNFKLQTIRQEITGTPYEEKEGKFYVDRNGSLRTITWKDDDNYDDLLF